MNEAIGKAYHNAKTGYVSRQKLYEKLDGKYSHEEIDAYFAQDNTVQSFKRLTHKPVLEPIQIYKPFELWELDLIDYNGEPDRGYKYVMVVIDDFTKYVWAEPMASKDEAHFGDTLHKILSESSKLPQKIMSDGEAAMSGAYVQKMLRVNNIEWIDRHKYNAPTVERMIKTIKSKLERIYVDKEERGGWSKYLKDIVYNINHTPSMATHVAPIDALHEIDTVRENLMKRHARVLASIDVQKLAVGDHVKIATRSFLQKGTKPLWSTKTYTVIKKIKNRVMLEGGDTVSAAEVVKVR
jgi:hypothetical protein